MRANWSHIWTSEAAVAVVGGEAGERGGLAVVEGAQFGMPAWRTAATTGPMPAMLLHAFGAGLHRLVRGELRGDGRRRTGRISPCSSRASRARLWRREQSVSV